jgi:hypothetical protein
MPDSGNIADQSAIEVDTTAPTTPAITAIVDNVGATTGALSLDVGQGNTDDNTLVFQLTAETGSTVRVYTGTPLAPVFVGLAVETTTSGQFEVTLDVGLADGSYSFFAVSTDKAGNNSAWSAITDTFVIDTVATLEPTLQALATTVTTPVVTGWVTLGAGETFVVKVNGVIYEGVEGNGMTLSANAGVTTWNLQLPALTMNETYEVEVVVTDLAGNTRQDPSSAELVLENIAPTVLTFESSTVDGAYKAGSVINLSAVTSETVRAGSQIALTLNTGATVLLTADAQGTRLSGNYTVAEGQNTADLTVNSFTLGSGAGMPTDLAGNAMASLVVPNNLALTRAIVIDTLAPVTPVLTVNDNSNPVQGLVAASRAVLWAMPSKPPRVCSPSRPPWRRAATSTPSPPPMRPATAAARSDLPSRWTPPHPAHPPWWWPLRPVCPPCLATRFWGPTMFWRSW